MVVDETLAKITKPFKNVHLFLYHEVLETVMVSIKEFNVKFIPAHLSILHVEQEVVGDDTLALQSVLESDIVRESLLAEEISINKKLADG